MNTSELSAFVTKKWDDEIVPQLTRYIRIPCKSPHFDARWQVDGHMEAAVSLAADCSY